MARTLNVCIGPECRAQGSLDLLARLEELVAASGCVDRVLAQASGCRMHCKKPASVGVMPDPVWFDDVGPADAEHILARTLELEAAGGPVRIRRGCDTGA